MIDKQKPSSPIYILPKPILNSPLCTCQLLSLTQCVKYYQNTRREVARDTLLVTISNGLSSFRACLL